MGFLIIVNFILAMVAIFAVMILFKRQSQLLELEKKYNQLNEQLEDSMSSFFMQMQEENEAFIKKLKEIQKQNDEPVINTTQKEEQKLVENNEPLQRFENNINKDIVSINNPPLYSGVKAYQQMQHMVQDSEPVKEKKQILSETISEKEENENKELVIDEIENSELLSDHEIEITQIKKLLMAGESIEEIAKKLDKGKTEVELLIKFSPELQGLYNNHSG